jgi:uncharacterized protein YbbC (DUF1343 family)
MTGIDRLLALPRLPRPGARVGLLAHAASLTRGGQHCATALALRREWSLRRLFCPEHGFFGRGAAGEPIQSGIHPALGIPIHSLYGQHRSPPPEWLDELDLLVIDLQDLGVRCYTYASTLQNVLRAAAARLPVLVLDRPTPLAGITDGPALDPAFRSFVGQIDLPLVFGLSQGPLARHLRATDPLLASLELDTLDGDGVADPWHPPSPGIVSPASALLYPLTVWCEAIGGVDVDRGGPDSFQIWGMPGLPARALAEELDLAGIRAVPAQSPRGWPALRFELTDRSLHRPVQSALRLLSALQTHLGPGRLWNHPESRPAFFDQLMGSGHVRRALQETRPLPDIWNDWN